MFTGKLALGLGFIPAAGIVFARVFC